MSGSRSSSSGRSSSGTSGRSGSNRAKRRNSRRFLLRLVLFFAIAFGLWYVSAPVITPLLSFGAEKVIFLCDGYDLTKAIRTSGHTMFLVYAPSPDGKPWPMNYRNVSFGVVFLVALIMAVPDVRPKLRLKILLLGLAIVYCAQVFRVVIEVFNYYGQNMLMDGESLYPVFWRKTLFQIERAMARLDGQAIPVMIWAGLYFYFQWYNRYFKNRSS